MERNKSGNVILAISLQNGNYSGVRVHSETIDFPIGRYSDSYNAEDFSPLPKGSQILITQ